MTTIQKWDFADTNIFRIARQCYETNRVYCESIGDYTQPHWLYAPAWQRESAILGVRKHLDYLEKFSVSLPPDASHAAWYAHKLGDGWRYGPVKNAETKEHPCMVAYSALPAAQKLKDFLFGAVVKAFWDAAQ